MKYYLHGTDDSLMDGYLTKEDGRTIYTYDSDFKVNAVIHLYFNDVEIGQAVNEYGATSKYALFTGKKKTDRLITLGRFFLTRLVLESAGWQVSGDYMNLNYQIISKRKKAIATVSDKGREIEIIDENSELKLLLVILALILYRDTFKGRYNHE